MMILTALALAALQPVPLPPRVTPPFEPMEYLIGHCWQGEIAPGQIDTHCFEKAYGGRFIRDRHEVTGGYAGETIYNWNAVETRAEFTYWSSAGGVSRGTMKGRDGLLEFGDQVYRGADGREQRIATNWRQLDATSYEARVTSPTSPTANRVVRYTRLDAAPVRMSQSVGANGTRTLAHEVVVPAPPAQVYAAFSTPEGWRTWAVPHAWSDPGDADVMETSYSPAAARGDVRNIQQRFVARMPDRLIVFRTTRTPPGFPHAAEYLRVVSVVELEPVGGGTRVRLTGTGYPAGAAGDTLLGFFRDGNRTSLEQLRARFASGPVDWAKRQAAAGK